MCSDPQKLVGQKLNVEFFRVTPYVEVPSLLVISMRYITLYVIDMDNIRCCEPFLPLYDHFEI